MINYTFFFDLHLYASLFMTGVIWTIHLLHYPTFFYVEDAQWPSFHRFHCSKISLIVLVPMTIELASSIGMLLLKHSHLSLSLVLLNLFIWLSTFLIYAPLHQKLSPGKDLALVQKLNRLHWPRFLLWNLKLLLVFTVPG